MNKISINIDKNFLKIFLKNNKEIISKYKSKIDFNKNYKNCIYINNYLIKLNFYFIEFIFRSINLKNFEFTKDKEVLAYSYNENINISEKICANKFIENYNDLNKKIVSESEKNKDKKRISVLLAPDTRGWAFDNIANGIIENNPYKNEIVYDIMYTRDMGVDDVFDREDEYDYIYVMFEGETRFLNSKKIIRGCYSQFWRENKSFDADRIANYFSECAGAVFVNETVRDAIVSKVKGKFIFDIIEDSTNPNIFYPIKNNKNKNFTAIFVGNTKRKLKNYEKIVEACKKANIELITCSNIDNKDLVWYYNKAHICINFSDHEGGPQTFLESGLCEVPMIIREGNDLSKKIPCFTVSDFNDLIRNLIFLKNNKDLCEKKGVLARSTIITNFTYSKVSKKFGDLILKIDKEKNGEMKLKKDLRKELTVFVVSCGKNPNYVDCIDSLNKQNSLFNIKYIKDISPMSKAFQKMIDECDTKYYIQVDEDMILKEDSIEKIYESIKNSSDTTHSVCFLLKDSHLDFNLYGIKAYKHDVMKNHPYNFDVISCEVEQLSRIEKSGYKNVFIEDVVGLHSPKWTEELIFERYFDLMEKWKIYKYHWMGELPAKLIKIYEDNPTNLNLFALMGAMTSISTEQKLRNREKNFTIEDENFKRIKELVSIKSFNHIK